MWRRKIGTWLGLRSRNVAASPRGQGGMEISRTIHSGANKHEELKKVFIHCKALSWVLGSIFQFVFGVFLERQFFQWCNVFMGSAGLLVTFALFVVLNLDWAIHLEERRSVQMYRLNSHKQPWKHPICHHFQVVWLRVFRMESHIGQSCEAHNIAWLCARAHWKCALGAFAYHCRGPEKTSCLPENIQYQRIHQLG